MTTRKYTSRSQQTTLTGSVTSGALTLPVVSATTLLGGATVSTGQTMTIVIDPDTSLEEVVDIYSPTTNPVAGNNLTVVRGQDGSSAQDHSAGAVVRHMIIGRDLREANTHQEASNGVHGLASTSSVVGTQDAQTLYNKTLIAPTLTATTENDAGIVFQGTTVDAYTTTLSVIDPTANRTITLPNTSGTVDLLDSATTLTNKTLTSPTINGTPVITGLSSTGMSTSSATPKSYVDSILGSATAASTSAASAATSASSAATSATSAAASATAAATSATSAAASATAAATSATSASTYLTSVQTSATSAANSATAAASSATTAANSVATITTSANSAATSAASAATSAASAAASTSATSASSAAASASSITGSVAAAATSATSAANSATAAATSASSASTSASSALTSQTAAATSAASAATSQTAAATSASSAATSASSAATSASSALTSQTAAATSATSAAASQTAAATSATSAAASATAAATSASSAATSASSAATSATSAAASVSASVPKSTVTAKGDLIAGTAASTVTNLAVGTDGQTLVANSANASGLGWQPLNAAGKNAVINGGMDIWQRGTSFTNPVSAATAYSADRWLTCRYGYATNITTSRVASGLTGFNYAMRLQRNVGDAAGSAMFASYNCETADSLRFAGQTVTVSVYFRAGASFSGVSSTAFVTLHSGTGTDQNIVTGFTGDSTLINATPTISTTIQRFSYSAAVPSNATQVGLQLGWNPTGTAGANDYLDIVGVQLELGSVATTFSRAGDVLQGELAACQRYYYRAGGSTAYQYFCNSAFLTATATRGVVPLPITMRSAPTFGSSAANTFLVLSSGNTAGDSGSSISTDNLSNSSAAVNVNIGTSRTAGIATTVLANNNVNTFLEFSAEL